MELAVDTMRIQIPVTDLQPGDVYQNRRIVYVGGQGDVVYVDFRDGGYKMFSKDGQIEVERQVERIEI